MVMILMTFEGSSRVGDEEGPRQQRLGIVFRATVTVLDAVDSRSVRR